MMKKTNIVIIGGGISGLALLHYLKKKYSGRTDIDIALLEKGVDVGGTIQSVRKGDCVFETGPNGFLSNKPRMFTLIEELDLSSRIVLAQEAANTRFISVHDRLYAVPKDPKSFLKFPLLNPFDKLRIFAELFIPRGNSPSESVYDFAWRRFGRKTADLFLDPMISGIYSGDAKKIILSSVFPKIYEMELNNGSILRSIKNLRSKGGPAKLHSFKGGMGDLIEALHSRYRTHIKLKETVTKISHRQDRYVVSTENQHYKADELYLCVPAFICAELLSDIDKSMADDLAKICYAPVAVVGIVAPENVFKVKPAGFGYLVPSSEKKNILGVLFESNIFPNRAALGQILFRVMMGGVRHPEILKLSEQELIATAVNEIKTSCPTKGNSAITKIDLSKVLTETFITVWKNAIPQYDQTHLQVQRGLSTKLKRFRDLYLLGNYRYGVSLNDCIENAYTTAQKSSF